MGNDAAASLFKDWVYRSPAKEGVPVFVLREKVGARAIALAAIATALEKSLLPEKVLRLAGGERLQILAAVAAASLKARSGELGEVLATEYVALEKNYPVFIRRLRYKDGQDLAMRGDDFLAFRNAQAGDVEVLKVESKARNELSTTVTKMALEGLKKFEGRPNPQSVAFVVMRLYEEGRDDDAELVKKALNRRLEIKQVGHLAFTVSSNDPRRILLSSHTALAPNAAREMVGLAVNKYHDLLAAVYGALHGKK